MTDGWGSSLWSLAGSPTGPATVRASGSAAACCGSAILCNFSVAVLAKIVDDGGHFLSRVQFQTLLWAVGGELPAMSLISYLCRLDTGGGVIDRPIVLGDGRRRSVRCRLIVWPVPPEVADRRGGRLRRVHRRKKGREPSAEALAVCDWNALVSDLPAERLSVPKAMVLYRSRWQIELMFKRWKSHCRIDLIDGRNAIEQRCRFWIRLCGAMLQQHLVSTCCWTAGSRCSFSKFTASLGRSIPGVLSCVANVSKLTASIEHLARMAAKHCRRDRRRKAPTWIDLLEDPDKLTYDLT